MCAEQTDGSTIDGQIDCLAYSGNLDNLADVATDHRHRFIHGNIRDNKLVDDLVRDCDAVVHCAAESHVDRSIADSRPFVETNTLGAMAWLDEAADWLAAAGAGSIVGISSMAAERGRRAAPAYGASKAALNTFLESLCNRLSSKGVHVLTVKPGFVRTVMLEGRSGVFWVTESDEAARQILRAIERRRREVFVSPRWRLVSWLVRAMPSFLFRRLPI